MNIGGVNGIANSGYENADNFSRRLVMQALSHGCQEAGSAL